MENEDGNMTRQISEINKSESRKILILAISLGSIFVYLLTKTIGLLSEFISGSFMHKTLVLWQIIVLLSTFIIPTILFSMYPRQKQITSIYKYDIWFRLVNRFFRSISIIILLFYFSYEQQFEYLSLNLEPVEFYNYFNILLSSLIIFIYFWGGISLFNKHVLKKKIKIDLESPEFLEIIDIKPTWLRILSLFVTSLSSMSEEFLYRGYIVLFLGYFYDLLYIFGAISIVLSVMIHIYQGRDKIIFHSLFALLFVGVTILSRNIFIATTIHIFNNLYTQISIWKIADKDFHEQRKISSYQSV
ncbi:MAG: CPBP family intramembrane metalloprotease [Anaerolineales bacterium]|nr:CPBP family intramembrane metalloprotease [Anaerolineales bacterium]